jgi:hypothetical protein
MLELVWVGPLPDLAQDLRVAAFEKAATAPLPPAGPVLSDVSPAGEVLGTHIGYPRPI